MWELIFKFCVGHALGDYALQNDFIAKAKNHRANPGNPIWVWVLLGHALIHAGIVYYISGMLLVAVAELIAHTVIDFAKSEGWLSFHVDQALHILCKLCWMFLLMR